MSKKLLQMQTIVEEFKSNLALLRSTIKWVFVSIVIGIVVGFVSGSFGYILTKVTNYRLDHSFMLYFLPIGSVIIVFLYRNIMKKKDPGTNQVLSAIHSDEDIPLHMAPLIYISTIITHTVGGSAGREGAALQLGGSIGNAISGVFGFKQKESRHIMIMCGMSAAFAGLFGTPIAAAVFAMEVVSVGIMHYAALLPCSISALISHGIAYQVFGIVPLTFDIMDLPVFEIKSALIISVLAILCGLLSIFFCVCLHETSKLFQKLFENLYVRAFVGGCVLLCFTLIAGHQKYNGTGTAMIINCMEGQIHSVEFLFKIIFTAITLACCFKGGEIVPTLYIGAAFGCLFGNLTGFSPSTCAAIGMGSIFCGVTNCPLTSLIICCELFRTDGFPFFLLAIGFSYTLSGYYGLYSSQKIVYSKYRSNFINKLAK